MKIAVVKRYEITQDRKPEFDDFLGEYKIRMKLAGEDKFLPYSVEDFGDGLQALDDALEYLQKVMKQKPEREYHNSYVVVQEKATGKNLLVLDLFIYDHNVGKLKRKQ